MKALDANGHVLDAEYDIEETLSGIDVVLHSNGGVSRGKPALNPDYITTLETILIRLGRLGGSLQGAWVDSKALANLPLDDRRVRLEEIDYPIQLAGIPDIREFRLQIRRSVSRIGQAPGTGNKKLRLAVSFENPSPLSLVELALRGGTLTEHDFVYMLGDSVENLDQLSFVPGAPDLRDIGVRKSVWDLARNAKPIVKHRMSRYVERGQVGMMVKAANGYRCQVCDSLGRAWEGFLKPDGYRYVEAHHVVLVSTLADDVLGPQNVITVCPNHHRQLHFGGVLVKDHGDEFEFTLSSDVIVSIQKFRNSN